MQLDLIPTINPLLLRFGNDFFSGIPEMPGIYLFKGENDQVLYVGKSKNLKKRLNSYKYLKPGAAGKAKWKMLHIVNEIEWFEQESEIEALKLENEFIDILRPKFNHVNKFPEYYHYLNVFLTADSVVFELDNDISKDANLVLGAFKSRKAISPVLTAYFRWAEFLQDPSRRFVLSDFNREQWKTRELKVKHSNTVLEMLDSLKGTSDSFVLRCAALGIRSLAIDCPLTRFTLIENSKLVSDSFEKNFSKQRFLIPGKGMASGFVKKQDLNNWLVDLQYQSL